MNLSRFRTTYCIRLKFLIMPNRKRKILRGAFVILCLMIIVTGARRAPRIDKGDKKPDKNYCTAEYHETYSCNGINIVVSCSISSSDCMLASYLSVGCVKKGVDALQEAFERDGWP